MPCWQEGARAVPMAGKRPAPPRQGRSCAVSRGCFWRRSRTGAEGAAMWDVPGTTADPDMPPVMLSQHGEQPLGSWHRPRALQGTSIGAVPGTAAGGGTRSIARAPSPGSREPQPPCEGCGGSLGGAGPEPCGLGPSQGALLQPKAGSGESRGQEARPAGAAARSPAVAPGTAAKGLPVARTPRTPWSLFAFFPFNCTMV